MPFFTGVSSGPLTCTVTRPFSPGWYRGLDGETAVSSIWLAGGRSNSADAWCSSPFRTVKALTPMLGMSSLVRGHSTRAVCLSSATRRRDSFFHELRRKVQTWAFG